MAGASSGAVRAGSAFVELFADPTKLDKGLGAAARRLQGWGDSLVKIGGAAFAAGMAIDAAFDRTAYHFVNTAFAAGQASARTGIAVEEVTALGFAAERAGGSAEGLQHALLHMSRTVSEAATGGREANEALLALGLSAAQLSGLAPDAAFKRLAGALAAVPNAMQRSAAAQKVFGRGVLEILPLLNMGAAGIEEFERRARELHLTVSADDVKAAREFQGLMAELKGSLSRVAYEVGKVALPALRSLREQVLPFVTKTIEWVQNNQGLVLSITKLGIGLAGLGAGILAVGFALKGLGAGLSALRLVPKLLGFLTSPVGAIAAALAVGAVVFFKYTQAGQEAFGELKETALEAWGGLKDAIEAGDLGAALGVVLAGLGVAWEQTWGKLSKYLKDTWSDFKLTFLDGVSDMIFSSGFLTKAMVVFGQSIDKIRNKLGLLSDDELRQELAKGELIAGLDEGGRKKLRDAIMADVNKRHGEELQAHQDDFDKDLADAKARLDAANAKAREARERAKKPVGGPGDFPGVSPFGGPSRAETAGTFAGLAAERLGAGASDAALTRVAAQLTALRLKEVLDFWRGA